MVRKREVRIDLKKNFKSRIFADSIFHDLLRTFREVVTRWNSFFRVDIGLCEFTEDSKYR